MHDPGAHPRPFLDLGFRCLGPPYLDTSSRHLGLEGNVHVGSAAGVSIGAAHGLIAVGSLVLHQSHFK